MITFDYRGGRGFSKLLHDYRERGGSPKYYIIILILVLNNEYFT